MTWNINFIVSDDYEIISIIMKHKNAKTISWDMFEYLIHNMSHVNAKK